MPDLRFDIAEAFLQLPHQCCSDIFASSYFAQMRNTPENAIRIRRACYIDRQAESFELSYSILPVTVGGGDDQVGLKRHNLFYGWINETTYSLFFKGGWRPVTKTGYSHYFIGKAKRVKSFRYSGGKRNNALRTWRNIYNAAYFVGYLIGKRYARKEDNNKKRQANGGDPFSSCQCFTHNYLSLTGFFEVVLKFIKKLNENMKLCEIGGR